MGRKIRSVMQFHDKGRLLVVVVMMEDGEARMIVATISATIAAEDPEKRAWRWPLATTVRPPRLKAPHRHHHDGPEMHHEVEGR